MNRPPVIIKSVLRVHKGGHQKHQRTSTGRHIITDFKEFEEWNNHPLNHWFYTSFFHENCGFFEAFQITRACGSFDSDF
jgi:hypothetical protein